MGLTLHPFDLATNRVLALVGRLEVRDWIDVMSCNSSIQPLGYLFWAAAGKDPGPSPPFIVDEAARSSRYSQAEVDAMPLTHSPRSAAEMSQQWRVILREAREIIDFLPAAEVGKCDLPASGDLLNVSSSHLVKLLREGDIRFHAGCLRGAYSRFMAE